MSSFRILVVRFVGLGTGCTSPEESNCISQQSAQVSIAGSNGDFEVEASGLQPGSDLRLTSDKLGETARPITDGGEPDEQGGLLGNRDGEFIVITAVVESGEPRSVELTLAS